MDAAARLLRLLSLLTSQPTWGGAELAGRLQVTTRTLRRDITRLRDLGYPVEATAGVDGGYRLGPGGRLPPLLLGDDEAAALAIGLRLAADAGGGAEAPALSALAKLEQVLPDAVRERVRSLGAATVALPPRPLPAVDPEVLLALAAACRWGEGVRFTYRTHAGEEGERSVEAHRLVQAGRRWYLVARDRSHGAWRTYRVDRIEDPRRTGHRYVHEDPPDAAELVSQGTTVAPWSVQAVLLLAIDVAEARRRFPASVGVVEAAGAARSRLSIGAERVPELVTFVAGLDPDVDVEVLEPPELREAVREHGRRLAERHGGRR